MASNELRLSDDQPLVASQQEIAEAYCPDILHYIEDLKHQNRIGSRIKPGPIEKRQPDTTEDWVLKARREIAAELIQEWCEEFGMFLRAYKLQLLT